MAGQTSRQRLPRDRWLQTVLPLINAVMAAIENGPTLALALALALAYDYPNSTPHLLRAARDGAMCLLCSRS
jgi:hypothetical protein